MKFFHILEKDIKQINSIDELVSTREESEPLPKTWQLT